MNEWVQDIGKVISTVEAIIVIAAFIITAAGILSGFPVQGGIIVAIIITVTVIFHVIRKPQVVGTYNVKGKNPINDEQYSGELQIKKQGELLSGTWKIGAQRGTDASKPSDKGTGLLVGKALAFSYEHCDPDDPYIGVSLYKIRGNHMSGKWAVEGKTNAGFEECSKERA